MPELPMCKREARPSLDKGSNSGLMFYKFVDLWTFKDGKYGLGDNKKDWVNIFARPHGRPDEVARATARVRKLAQASVPAGVTNEPKEFISVSRFATGLGYEHGTENGFVWHHTLGVPYIPSSGIKGMIRAWADHWQGLGSLNGAEPETAEWFARIVELFGNYGPRARNEADRQIDAPLRAPQMGRLIVFDALPVNPVRCVAEVMTPHDGGWRAKGPVQMDGAPGVLLSPGDWHAPVPIPFLAVDEGQTFLFSLGLARGGTQQDLDDGYRLLEEALAWIGAGAKTASGFGRFMTADAIEVLRDTDIKNEQEREAARATAEAEEFEAWMPKVGDILRQTEEDRPGKILVEVVDLDGPDDIRVRHRDGTDTFWVEKAECAPHAASWDEA